VLGEPELCPSRRVRQPSTPDRCIRPVSFRYPFLTLDEAAGFLGVSTEKARKLYDDGELPRTLRLDGGLFEPSRAVT
jgi:hypothetical protein